MTNEEFAQLELLLDARALHMELNLEPDWALEEEITRLKRLNRKFSQAADAAVE